ncbi:MAG TPA: phosphotransferase [Kofleriaceae bacterium]
MSHDSFSERVALAVLHGALAPVATPALLHVGELGGWPYLVMTRLDGTPLEDVWPGAAAGEQAQLLEQIGALIAQVHALDPGPIAAIGPRWDDFVAAQRAGCVARHTRLALPAPLLAELDAYLDRVAPAIPRAIAPVILTGEYTPANLLVTRRAGRWQITGLIDFGDVGCGAPDYDLLGPATFLAAGDPAHLRALLVARGYSPGELVPALRDRLMALLGVCSDADYLLSRLRVLGWGWHHGFTHSVVFAVLVGATVRWGLGLRGWRGALACVLPVLSHPLLDYVVTESPGVALWWPVTGRRTKLGIDALSYYHLIGASEGALAFVRLCAAEVVLFGPIFAVAVLASRQRFVSYLSPGSTR